MVAGATNQPQQPSQLAPPPSSTEEEEFLKRNTDCVYFLASPLTCKKGSECEYRHSDIARVNPRDCWYWLNGNCLNPKCGFRHPPLDGLLATEVPTPVGPSVPPAPVTPYAAPKQGVACIFFQKGFCLKGHLCPFLHGPPNKVAAQPAPPNPVTKQPPRMASAAQEKPVQEQKLTQPENVQKPVEFLPPQRKQVPRVQTPALARNGGGVGFGVEKRVPPPPSEEPPRYKPAGVVLPPAMNEFSGGRSNHGSYETHHVSDNDSFLNGKDGDEYSREPTPGFDVLVDNELGDSEYYHNEDQFGRSGSHDFDLDRDMYNEHREYERYAWEDHEAPAARMLAGAASLERKRHPDSPDRFDESDLRHRISKQRRGHVGSLRSVVSREHPRDSHADRRRDRDRDSHHRRPDPTSLSRRLRGRIKIPGRSVSPGTNNGPRVEREIDMGRRNHPRYSPGRPPHALSNHHSRLRDRIKGRISEDYDNEGRDHRGSRGSDNDSEFTGPKRLSELKSSHEEQTLGKRKYPKPESQPSAVNLSFEGPKPLSEILKRKRGAEPVTNEVKENNQTENKEPEKQMGEPEKRTGSNQGEPEKQTGSNQGEPEKQTGSNQGVAGEPEKEVGLMDEDAMLDQELEAYDHKDGDYDYEQIDGEDYNLEEYMEEEEGEGYEKKDICS